MGEKASDPQGAVLRLAGCLLLACLADSSSGCQRHKQIVFLDTAWNRDYAMNACESYKKNRGVTCLKTPDQIAAFIVITEGSA